MCLALEGFACGERLDLYAAKINFLRRHAPGRSLDNIHIVSADGILNQSLMTTIGLPNAHFLLIDGISKNPDSKNILENEFMA